MLLYVLYCKSLFNFKTFLIHSHKILLKIFKKNIKALKFYQKLSKISLMALSYLPRTLRWIFYNFTKHFGFTA